MSRTLDTKVELRQLGARDEARVQGGIGPCGRDLCCATFLKDFEPVSVRMAKDQQLPVNPLRIAGAYKVVEGVTTAEEVLTRLDRL